MHCFQAPDVSKFLTEEIALQNNAEHIMKLCFTPTNCFEKEAGEEQMGNM